MDRHSYLPSSLLRALQNSTASNHETVSTGQVAQSLPLPLLPEGLLPIFNTRENILEDELMRILNTALLMILFATVAWGQDGESLDLSGSGIRWDEQISAILDQLPRGARF